MTAESDAQWTQMRKVEDAYDADFDAVVSDSYSEKSFDPDEIHIPPEPIPDGVYGLALASMIHDAASVAHEDHGLYAKAMKGGRLCSSCFILLMCLGLQFFLLVSTKTLITPSSVKSTRKHYDLFERTLYDGHIRINRNNFARGLPGYFNASRFDLLPDKDKDFDCEIPLSNPLFLFVILMIWTMTVLSHVRNNGNLALRLCFAVKTIPSVKDGLQDDSGEIVGLTCFQKISVAIMQTLVLCMNFILLWLGARWLVATNGFADLLLNSIALEFILDLPELIFRTMVPKRTQVDVANTLVPMVFKKEGLGVCNLCGMYLLGVFGCIAVLLYMFVFQRVLPGYNYDVAGVCKDYLAAENRLKG